MAPVVEIISPCLLGGPGGCFGNGYIVVDTVHIKAGHSLKLCWTIFSFLYPQNICRYIYFSPLLCWSVAPSFWLIKGSLCFQGVLGMPQLTLVGSCQGSASVSGSPGLPMFADIWFLSLFHFCLPEFWLLPGKELGNGCTVSEWFSSSSHLNINKQNSPKENPSSPSTLGFGDCCPSYGQCGIF